MILMQIQISLLVKIPDNGSLPFLGVLVKKSGTSFSTEVYRKPTNTGLLSHYQSHIDARYKRSLVKTMVFRAYQLTSTWPAFDRECMKLKDIFKNLNYPHNLIDQTINDVLKEKFVKSDDGKKRSNPDAMLMLPYKDEKSAQFVRRQLRNITTQIGVNIRTIFKSRNVHSMIKKTVPKPPYVNSSNVIYRFECDSCDASYIGFTSRHLFQRVAEHKFSVIGDHRRTAHDDQKVTLHDFKVLRKCSPNDLRVFEMLLIKEHRPSLNGQKDSCRPKLLDD